MREWLQKKRGDLTQEQVARTIGISRGAYANIENGKRDPSVSTAKKIAAVLDFEWQYFFDEESVDVKRRTPL